MRHQVGVLEDELDRLARLHDDHFLVVRHPLGQRADADDADAELAAAPRGVFLASSAGSSAASASANSQRIERGRRRSARRPAILRTWRQASVEQRPALRPSASRRAGFAAWPGSRPGGRYRLDEFGQRLERLRFLAADIGQGESWPRGGPRPPGRRRRQSNVGLDLRGRMLVLLEDVLAVGRRARVSVKLFEPLAEVAVGAVVDDDRLDRQLLAQIDFPPGSVGVFARCASGRRRRSSRSCCRRWPRLASPPWAVFFCVALPWRATFLPPLINLDLGQRQRAARRAARCARSGRACPCRDAVGRATRGRPSSSGSTFGYRLARRLGVARSAASRATKSCSAGTDLRRQRPTPRPTPPSTFISATKPIWRMTGCLADWSPASPARPRALRQFRRRCGR